MKIVGFAGSNSSTSINKSLVEFALKTASNADTELLDLNDFEVAIYSPDREIESGIPSKIIDFAEKISSADLLIISLAEHNGVYSAGFKNIYDWISRIPNRKVFDDKPLLLMATSPGARGGQGVLAAASERFPRDGANVKAVFSLPSFQDNFNVASVALTNSEKREELIQIIQTLTK